MNRRVRPGRLGWLGAGALGGALALGCQSAPPHPVVLATEPVVSAAPVPVALPSGNVVLAPASVALTRTAATAPVVAKAPPTERVPQLPPLPLPVAPPAPPPPIPRTAAVPPTPPPAAPLSTPAPVGPRYGHAPDYSSLTGELQYSHVQKAWRLRYAPLSEEDRYGGSVTLAVADELLGQLRAGQTVRIDGRLIDPESFQPSPTYRVSRLQPAR